MKFTTGGLLSHYFNKQVSEIDKITPDRSWVPKGEKKDPSSDNSKAALLRGITNQTLKNIAIQLECSYGTLRQQSLDKDFQKRVKVHCQAFSIEISSFLKKQITVVHENGFITIPSSQELPELVDIELYNDSIFAYLGCFNFNFSKPKDLFSDPILMPLSMIKALSKKKYKLFLAEYLKRALNFLDNFEGLKMTGTAWGVNNKDVLTKLTKPNDSVLSIDEKIAIKFVHNFFKEYLDL